MRVRRPAAFLLIALALAACSKKAADDAPVAGAPVAAVPPPAGKAWSDVVAATPEGGMRMGNPNAAVKLVEYASFTCPHCARFTAEGAPVLRKDFVDSGKVSYEFRSTVIHGGLDVAFSLLMACRGAETYFPVAEQLFAGQTAMLDKAQARLTAAEQQRLQSLSPADQFKAFTEYAGAYAFFVQRGLPRVKAEACLSDAKTLDTLTANQQRYSTQDNITGTPTFFLNGQVQDGVNSWEQLQPRLKAAVG